jgi:sugar lactone lactonase YvrE
MVTTIAGNGQRALVDGRADTASFKGITAVCLDPFGNIYVTDVTAVRKLSPDGMLTTIAGSDIAGRSDGQGAAAQFVYLQGLVSDASGNIFVIDEDKIKKMTPDGTVTTVAGSGLHGFLDGAVAEAEFAMPWGIALDKQGNIYVADWENYRIRKIVIQ